MERRLSAILAADVVGYSRLMGTDEVGTLAALKSHRSDLIDTSIARHNGRIVKLMGDGALIEFPSVTEAVQCAVEIQTGTADRNKDVPEDKRIQFRIGVNVGDVIVEGDDIYGDGVNVAARLEGLAAPNGICVSDMVYQGVVGKLGVAFEDLGEQSVKNIARPVRAYRIVLENCDPAGAAARTGTGYRQVWRLAGLAAFGIFAVGGFLAWVMLGWSPTGSADAACADHLGLPVAAEQCQEAGK